MQTQVYRTSINMGWFGTETLKPTHLFHNHKCFGAAVMQISAHAHSIKKDKTFGFVRLHSNDMS